MKKYLIAAALIVGFSVPALAVETFYIMFDNTMKGARRLHDHDLRADRQEPLHDDG